MAANQYHSPGGFDYQSGVGPGGSFSVRGEVYAARTELRRLDIEISRTKAGLMTIPPLAPSGGIVPGTAFQKGLASRTGVSELKPTAMRKLGDGAAGVAGWTLGRRGMIGLQSGALMASAGGAVLASHVIGATGNQILDWAEERKNLSDTPGLEQRFGGSGGAFVDFTTAFSPTVSRQFSQITGAGRLGTLIGRLTGRFTSSDEGQEYYERMFNRWEEEGILGRDHTFFGATRAGLKRKYERNEKFTEAQVHWYTERRKDLDYLDEWTPETFLVSGEGGLAALRAEVKEKNMKYLDALTDQRIGAARRVRDANDPSIKTRGN